MAGEQNRMAGASALGRTSLTHPLQIAEVRAKDGYGRIGITFCPGKKQANAFTGSWNRDLCVDLDAVRQWGPALVVTLIEQHELDSLQVPTLEEEVQRRHMDWLHLPIPDYGVPPEAFETKWNEVGEGIRARLRDGFDVLVHCKGGLGRAGTITARLLVECGMPPDQAIRLVRKVRPGAIETGGQENHVRRQVELPERQPATDQEATRDRAHGTLLGLAVGDAVGTTLEFKSRDSYLPITDMVGGGPFRRKPGGWTDDTAMALALAESLIAHPGLDERDLMARFTDWYRNGAYSCVGVCDDIGITTRQALAKWERTGDPLAGSTDPQQAGNGSLMRLAPVALRWWHDREKLRDVAARQSRTTHGAPEAVDACIVYAEMLADAIAGRPRSAVLHRPVAALAGKIPAIIAGSWRGKRRDDIQATGYVAHALEASLWCIGRTGDFRSAVLTAANLGQDADTTAAITGQLAGALYGASGIPPAWRERVAWAERIQDLAGRLITFP